MKQLLTEVQASVQNEYDRAVERFGRCNNSNHESYAVILEEFEEAQEQAEKFKGSFDCFWHLIRSNNENTLEWLKVMQECAEHAAAEWIQVAAMCHKATIRKDDEQ